LAQVSDTRVTALEEQIRSLSGTIEELNFQILQMQEQMRKMQEDNEFRFQELEKRSDAGGGTSRSVASSGAQPAQGEAQGAPQPSGGAGDMAANEGAGQTLGAPPRSFGTI